MFLVLYNGKQIMYELQTGVYCTVAIVIWFTILWHFTDNLTN